MQGLLPLRLSPGEDLRAALEAAARRLAPQGAFVLSGIGSLSDPRLRLAGAETALTLSGPFELLTLAGTLTAAQGAHLHMTVADAQGRVWGGHVLPGNRVRTTVELLLLAPSGWQLTRAPDPATGYAELQVQPAPVIEHGA